MKHKSTFGSAICLGIICILLLASCSQNQNWPQFRGSSGNMMTAATDLPEKWDSINNIAWKFRVDGQGWSSPIICGNKVFITSSFPEKVAPVPVRPPVQAPPPRNPQVRPPQGSQGAQPAQGRPAGPPPPPPPPPDDSDTTFKQDIYRWELICLELSSGRELWRQVAYRGHPKVRKHEINNYATETPVTDGERVYAYFGNIGLFCYDTDGNILWQKDLGAYKVLNGWGTGSSPILYDGMLYIQADNEENSFIVALDGASGEEKWKISRDEKTNYSTPYIWKNKMRTELVTNGKTSRSYDPESGEMLWELKTGGEMTIPSATGDEDKLYIGNTGGMNAKSILFAVKAGASGNITPRDSLSTGENIEWILRDAALGNSSPLLYNGKLYVIANRGGEVKCINTASGSLVYKERISGTGTVWACPWVFNDKIWFTDEKGVTRSFKAGDKFDLADVNRIDDQFWTSVAISDRAYVFRGVECVYCVRK